MVSWEAPGPGTWELDSAHITPTVSAIVADLIEECVPRGLGEGFELLGAPLDRVDARFVHGGYYMRLVPLVGGESDRPPPPDWALKAVTRVHPAFRKRAKQSVKALEERLWLSEFERWEREWKPRLIGTNRAFGSVDPSRLGGEDLADHLDALMSHVRWSNALHFRLHCSDLGPIGRLLVRAEDIGLDRAEVMSALAGSTPATSAPARAAAEIACELTQCGVTPTSLDEVRSASERAHELLEQYLAEFGARLTTGYDITDRTLSELPDVVLGAILAAQAEPARHYDDAAGRGGKALDDLLADVAPETRDEMRMLVDDARLLYGLRDENGPLTYEWPAGILRHAVLEIGRRLDETGRLVDAAQVFDLRADEMSGLLRGAERPDCNEVAVRHAERMARAHLDHPPFLGAEPSEPSFDVLPGEMPLLMRAVTTVMVLLEADDTRNHEDELSGTGVGELSYRGVARVVVDADDAFDRVEPGDIVVTRLTVPTYNSVLAMAGGVVTEFGGLLCHTAVIARELGIPAVVGVAGALNIPDGAAVEVDPVAGRVTVLD